jgi:hypothetical protein
MPADVTSASEKNWNRWKHDCSGFAHAVAEELGVSLDGDANEMVDAMNADGSGWIKLGHSGGQAQKYANDGYFVVAGLKASGHGHVAVIVPSAANSAYPIGYWGRYGGTGRKNTAINWSWNHSDLPQVEYFAMRLPGGDK